MTVLADLQGVAHPVYLVDSTGAVVAGNPATIADGADVTQGAKADAAWSGTGSGSVVALLKALYASFIAPTPAGTNVIGGVTVADGSNSAEGAKADAAYADSTGAASGSIVALLKGAYVGLKGVLTVGGNIASGSADSGNPVKIGGKYNSAPGSLSDGQRGDAQLDLKGSLKTTLFAADQANAITTATVAADGVSTGSFGLAMRGFSHIFNGTTWDRAKKAVSTSRIPSAANTTNATSAKASAVNFIRPVRITPPPL
jgi:hypothetical protein